MQSGVVLSILLCLYVTTATAQCPSTPCVQGGRCVDAQCICTEGWSGPTCSVPSCVNPIDGTTCSEAGTCIDGVCTCIIGRGGPTCRDTIVSCNGSLSMQHAVSTSCSRLAINQSVLIMGNNLATCVACANQCLPTSTNVNLTTCALLPIYTVPLCPGDTYGTTCSGNGQCIVTEGVAACVCSPGFSGKSCQTIASSTCPIGRTGSPFCYEQTCLGSGFDPCNIDYAQGGICNNITTMTPPIFTGSYIPEPMALANGTIGGSAYLSVSSGDNLQMGSRSSLIQYELADGTPIFPEAMNTAYEWIVGFANDATDNPPVYLQNAYTGTYLAVTTLGEAPSLVALIEGALPSTALWQWGQYVDVVNSPTPTGTLLQSISSAVPDTVSVYLEHPPLLPSWPPGVQGTQNAYILNTAGTLYYGIELAGEFGTTPTGYTTSAPAQNTAWTAADVVYNGNTYITLYNIDQSVYLAALTKCGLDGAAPTNTLTTSSVLVHAISEPCNVGDENTNFVSTYFSATRSGSNGVYISSSLTCTEAAEQQTGPGCTFAYFVSYLPTGGVVATVYWTPTIYPDPTSSWQLQSLSCNCAGGYTGVSCQNQPVGTAVCSNATGGVGPVAGGYIADGTYSAEVCTNGACVSSSSNGYCTCSTVWTGSGYGECVPGSARTVCSQPSCAVCPGGVAQTYDGSVVIPGGEVNLYLGLGCCPSAYTDTTRSVRLLCGGRGVCTRDGTCTCAAGLGGKYCCPLDSNALVCGPQGTCIDQGVCVCNSGWGGVTCNVDQRCSPSCDLSGGTCLTSDPLAGYLTELNVGLFFPPGDILNSPLLVNSNNVGLVTALLGVNANGTSNVVAPSLTTNPVAYVESWNIAIYLREVFLGYDPTSISVSSWWVNSAGTVTLSTDVYNSMLQLWSLHLFQMTWVGSFTQSYYQTLVNAAFLVVYPLTTAGDTCDVSASYCASLIAALMAAETREEYMRPLLAILVQQILRDPVELDGGVYPVGVVSQCICEPGFSGPQCALECPIGTNGQTCSGYVGAVQLGVCTADGCSCPFNRAGDACEYDLTDLCMSPGAAAVCSERGDCLYNQPSAPNTWSCDCPAAWTSTTSGTYCSISVCSHTTVECSNQGSCEDIETSGGGTLVGTCICNVASSLAASGSSSVIPVLPIGPLCALNGAPGCAVWSTACGNTASWLACSSCVNGITRGQCVVANATAGVCQCATGYSGTYCQNSLCLPECNLNQTCNLGTGQCQCLPMYTGANCTQQLCVNGIPASGGTTCDCFTGWRADSNGACTIVQCPFVVVLDTGPIPCPATGYPMCSSAMEAMATPAQMYAYSHANLCCYDQCVKSDGTTNCLLNTTTSVRTCACSPAVAFNEVGGVCESKCNGQTASSNGLNSYSCSCSNSWPLYPPLNPTSEYLTTSSCALVSCLNGATVASSGQSCVCAGGFSGATCATPPVRLPSSSASILSSSSSSSSTNLLVILSSSVSTHARSSSSSSSSRSSSTGGGKSSSASSMTMVALHSSSAIGGTSSSHNSNSSSGMGTDSAVSSSSSTANLINETNTGNTSTASIAAVSSSNSATLSAGAITGIVIGAVVVVALVAYIVYRLCYPSDRIAYTSTSAHVYVPNSQTVSV